MIAFGDNELPGLGKQLFPSRLKFEWIIALSKNRRQRKLPERTGERAVNVLVDCVGLSGIPHVAMKGTCALRADSAQECLPARPVEMASNAERGCS
jgi:hypothetical protein